MIWLIISLIVTIITIVYCWYKDLWCGVGTCILETIATLMVSFFITAFIVTLSSDIISMNDNVIEYNKVLDSKIIALKDNQNVNGNFYIMGEYIDKDLYYYYAIETEFGYKTEKIKAENAYIKYTNDEPHIEKYNPDFTNETLYFLGTCTRDDRYIIYCPDGTVTNEFNIDLE